MLKVIETPSGTGQDLRATLDELLHQGALTMLQQALEAEVEEYVARHVAGQMARKGKARVRPLVTGVGSRWQPFTSEILPTYVKQGPKVTELLPLLYLRGLSTGDFQTVLPILLGEGAARLSQSAIARLSASWAADYQAWRTRSLANSNHVYVWVEGVQFRVRPEENRLCTLVMMGVRLDGTKEIIAVEDGYRESPESWATMLSDLKRRGMSAPMVAVGDTTLGFWSAVGTVWSEAREQRCWVHQLAHGRQAATP